jgi:hypothetical protein
MSTTNKLTLTDLVLALRQRLIDAQEQDDKKALSELVTTFGILAEVSCTNAPRSICGIFEGLEQSASYANMGVGWKAPVLSVEAIKAACSPTEE